MQADAFCTVSLASIANSPTDPTSVTAVPNFTINQGFAGTYGIMDQVNYNSGYASPWVLEGTLIVDPPPSVTTPTVVLTDVSQSSGAYLSGDSSTVAVTGPPNQPVSVNINGVG